MSDLRILFRSVIKETAIGKHIRRMKNNRKLGSLQAAEDAFDIFMKSEKVSPDERKEIIQDMIRMSKEYRYGYDEYFLYNFRYKTDEERLKFVADLDRIDIVESLNKAINQPLFDDKARTYKKYSKFYKRDLCSIGGGYKDYSILLDFIKKKKRIIVKPADSSCGQGVEILDLEAMDNVEETLNSVLSRNSRGLIAEEVIIQDERMSSLHPESVNTLRITTLRMNDRIEIIHPFLKMGRGKSIVDNAGAGGIIGAIDKETGIVTHTGDEYGNKYDIHPESGQKIIGFQIPRWNEAVSLVNQLAMVTPSNRYTGWDVALSKNGWVLVEANARGQFVGWQIPTQIGFKPELNKLLKEIKT